MGMEIHKGGHEDRICIGGKAVDNKRRILSGTVRLMTGRHFLYDTVLNHHSGDHVGFFVNDPEVFQHKLHGGAPLPEISRETYLVTILTTVGSFLRILKVKDVGHVFFGGGDAPGILADDHVLNFFRKLQLYLFGDLFVFNNINRYIRIDEAEYVKVDIDGVVNFNDVLAAETPGTGVHHKSHRMRRFVETQPVKDPYALARFYVINNNPVSYLFDIKHFTLLSSQDR
jgi:hypothetical protein